MTTCPRCGTAFEGRFCIACGTDTQPPAFLCARCGTSFAGFACPACGLPLGWTPAPPPAGSGVRAFGSVVWILSMVSFLILVAVNLAVLAYSAILVVQGSFAGPRPIDLYLLAPFPVGRSYDVPADIFLAYFGLLVAAVVASHVWPAIRDRTATRRALVRPLDELRPRLEARSAIVATAQMFLAMLSFQVLVVLVFAAAGANPVAPDFPGDVPEWYPYYALVNASVYEELVTRWLLIGVPLVLGALALRRHELANAAAHGRAPIPAWRHLFGGTVTRDSPASVVLLGAVLAFFSAVVFGLAHVPSWGWWKFVPTFVAGLGLGYLFLRAGLVATILFHFTNNYMAAALLLTTESAAAQILLGLLIFLVIILGLVFFAWYLMYSAELVNHFAVAWGIRRPAPVWAAAAPIPAVYPMPPPVAYVRPGATPPPYGSGFVPFQCPRCGWRQARYADGRFTCLRCGHSA
ncbi:MAG: CPBP family intramembrane metalloprotease [Euryarchaeota archaeon]|nr:CPBP family intramembrane metalloprotease [Euryarchaeota archaeon]